MGVQKLLLSLASLAVWCAILVQYWFSTGSLNTGSYLTILVQFLDSILHLGCAWVIKVYIVLHRQLIERQLVDRRREIRGEIRGEIRRSQGLVSALYRVVSLDKKHYSTLFLSTQVDKWVPANCWGILTEKLDATLRWNNVTNMNSVLFSFATPIWSIFSRNPLRVTDTGCTSKNFSNMPERTNSFLLCFSYV